jgi:hypothetical protein
MLARAGDVIYEDVEHLPAAGVCDRGIHPWSATGSIRSNWRDLFTDHWHNQTGHWDASAHQSDNAIDLARMAYGKQRPMINAVSHSRYSI